VATEVTAVLLCETRCVQVLQVCYTVHMLSRFLNCFKTVLVVEDDPALQKVLTTKLQKKGYKTVTASSGREVLIVVAQTCPAGIILDLMLPGQDGMSILRQLRSPEVDYNKAVVVLTNLRGTAELRTEAESLQAQYFDKAHTPIDTVINALARAV